MHNTQTPQRSTLPVLGKPVTTFPTNDIVMKHPCTEMSSKNAIINCHSSNFLLLFFVKLLPSTYTFRPHLSLADKGNRKEEELWTAALKLVLHHVQVMLLMFPEESSAFKINNPWFNWTHCWVKQQIIWGNWILNLCTKNTGSSHINHHEIAAIQPKLLVILLRADLAAVITIHNTTKKMGPGANKNYLFPCPTTPISNESSGKFRVLSSLSIEVTYNGLE